ncbi:MAG: DUF443 family protein [Lachnospiraceae bacterium]|jgi:uncharacterized membrane protein (TIGR01218 family)|nr:DUF443 family protein [Lachnospiraceae bacterium]
MLIKENEYKVFKKNNPRYRIIKAKEKYYMLDFASPKSKMVYAFSSIWFTRIKGKELTLSQLNKIELQEVAVKRHHPWIEVLVVFLLVALLGGINIPLSILDPTKFQRVIFLMGLIFIFYLRAIWLNFIKEPIDTNGCKNIIISFPSENVTAKMVRDINCTTIIMLVLMAMIMYYTFFLFGIPIHIIIPIAALLFILLNMPNMGNFPTGVTFEIEELVDEEKLGGKKNE